jgi:hypothetical protein
LTGGPWSHSCGNSFIAQRTDGFKVAYVLTPAAAVVMPTSLGTDDHETGLSRDGNCQQK